jgi:hypothetical protein
MAPGQQNTELQHRQRLVSHLSLWLCRCLLHWHHILSRYMVRKRNHTTPAKHYEEEHKWHPLTSYRAKYRSSLYIYLISCDVYASKSLVGFFDRWIVSGSFATKCLLVRVVRSHLEFFIHLGHLISIPVVWTT